ncbi:DNA-binding protein [Streptomyces sp. NBC_01092]|uniref:DNA-binding protein n=1 Tax=Streptomyces sp. NBC_01092 TaxID=2903748 RepID=UPI00386AD50B|nr:helix-turn-helix domain-containing protein [Streptomyces sp. NBC_01092]
MSAWTREAVEAQGPTTEVPVLASILGVDKDTIYDAIRREEWSMTRVLRLGRRIKIPTHDIVTYLFGSAGASPAVPSQCQHDESPQFTAHQSQSQCGCTPAASGVVHQLRGA